ncbi:acyl-CoA synthetase [Nocardioides sp. AE5]|uniref:acyl-CoA synthetase n=1 Tax=Nocardioides sp. AE5 TaxID=2962573 RepID=UPI0028813F4A|nr:acyl-CoA synthetase [Nocardioides sp. AE5]MDT0202715.1 acyl-CoA synthetase [Nocardioides sp. AE5]
MALNIADLFEHVVDVVPDRLALILGEDRLTYAELDARANRFAHHLADAGVKPGEHVGLMARNVTEHVVAMLGTFKARAVPININYRYVEGELDYLFDNSKMIALVHEARYAPVLDKVVPRHALIREVVVIADETDHAPTTYDATPWAEAVAAQPDVRDFGQRSADDVFIVYTGGTTGYPKGVMWRHEDVWRTLGGGIDFATRERLDEFDQARQAAANDHPLRCLQLGPIMHANGQWGMLLRFFTGHTNVLLPKFDPAEIWRTVEAERVQTISLIGDAMARPLIEEYERGGYDASTLVNVNSAAAIFSVEVKERMLNALPNAVLMDIIGSSETGFTGNGRVEKSNLADKGSLVNIGVDMAVLDEEMNVIDPATNVGAIGLMARSGNIPLGYFGDPEKTARTFLEIGGTRYAVPGDWVQIEPDLKVTLLGRGSNCINTGGEKVYPEEVEVALKSHPGVFDTVVMGLPDPTYGQQVAALLEARPGHELDFDEVRAFLRSRLSGYKVPRTMHVVERIPRHVTGKADYKTAREVADSLAGLGRTRGVEVDE